MEETLGPHPSLFSRPLIGRKLTGNTDGIPRRFPVRDALAVCLHSNPAVPSSTLTGVVHFSCHVVEVHSREFDPVACALRSLSDHH